MPDLVCRFLAGGAARTTADALSELGTAFYLEEPPRDWSDVARAVPDGPVVLLILPAEFGVAEIAA